MGETNYKLQDYLKSPNKYNLFKKETDLKEVNKYLNKLDMKKANDIYGISTKVFKIGTSKQCSNYRPIFILPILSKIFEKLMYSRLIEFIDKHKILYKNNSAFKKVNLHSIPL